MMAIMDCGTGSGADQVLIVEDDRYIRESLKELLADEGFSVSTAEHGGQALTLLREGLRPAVVLLDLMMPIMNGWQFLEIIRADDDLQLLPVIVVSAAHGEGAPVGATACLNKPVSLDVLLQEVEIHRIH